jgi:HKD family nuclease
MKLEAIPNKGPASMGSEIDRSLHWAHEVDLASAFVTVAALKRLQTALEEAGRQKRTLRIRLLFGLYQRFTPPEALAKMLNLQKRHPGSLFVRVARNRRFHWKMYSFKKGSTRRLYVGSANFTTDGLTADGEMSLKLIAKSHDKVIKSIESEFESAWHHDAFTLNKSLLEKYSNLARPKSIITDPQNDKAISILLRAPNKQPTPPAKALHKPRLVYVDGITTEETQRILEEETNWDQKGWNTICFRYKGEWDLVKMSKVFLLVCRANPKSYEISFRRTEHTACIETPDGKYHLAHSKVPYGWCREYSVIKEELKTAGLTQNKIKSDRSLNTEQLLLFCRLLRIRPEAVGLG